MNLFTDVNLHIMYGSQGMMDPGQGMSGYYQNGRDKTQIYFPKSLITSL